jgi:hypothetical protein
MEKEKQTSRKKQNKEQTKKFQRYKQEERVYYSIVS